MPTINQLLDLIFSSKPGHICPCLYCCKQDSKRQSAWEDLAKLSPGNFDFIIQSIEDRCSYASDPKEESHFLKYDFRHVIKNCSLVCLDCQKFCYQNC